MSGSPRPESLSSLIALAEQLDSLADTAELMGDEPGARRFRDQAAIAQAAVMQRLDD